MNLEFSTTDILPKTAEVIITLLLVLLGLLIAYRARISTESRPPAAETTTGSIGTIGLMVLSVALFVGVLFFYWYTNISTPNAIAGFLPVSDSGLYFHCAQQILGFGEIGDGCRMRPLYSLFLALLLGITNLNLQGSFILQALLVGLSVSVIVVCIYRHNGMGAALFGLAAAVSIASPYIMAVMTENIGLLTSLPAIAILWRYNERLSPHSYAACIFLFAAAQNARPGAFFVILLILAWRWHSETTSRTNAVKQLVIGVFAIIAAFYLNSTLAGFMSSGDHPVHSNFAYILYGVTAGGKRYVAIFQEHPELFQQFSNDPKGLTQEMYRLAWNNFLTQPHMTVVGMARGIAHYYYELFRFVENVPTRAALLLFYCVGIFYVFKTKTNAASSLIIAYLIGVTASAAIVGFGGGPRIYAATFGFDIIIVAYGSLTFINGIKAIPVIGPIDPDTKGRGQILLGYPAIILLGSIASIFVLRQQPELAPMPSTQCPNNLKPVVFRPNNGSPTLGLTSQEQKTIFPIRADVTEFRQRIKKWVDRTEELKQIPEGTAVTLAFQLLDGDQYGRLILFRAKEDSLPESGVTKACIRYFSQQKGLSLAEAISFEPLQEPK